MNAVVSTTAARADAEAAGKEAAKDAQPPLIVAIDGPSGVGKSTTARALAQRLRVPFLDTGAMYRAVALAVIEAGVSPRDRESVEALAAGLDLRVERRGVDRAATASEDSVDTSGAPPLEVLLDGLPVEERIRTPEISAATSAIAVYPGVRERLVALQQATGRRFGAVVEGRDIGTRVFPGTPHKFFLDADPAIRAERRRRQLEEQGRTQPLEEVEREMQERDRRDSQRQHSPLTCDDTYQKIDTTHLTTEQVIDQLERAIRFP
jgi:cytidylate kinase